AYPQPQQAYPRPQGYPQQQGYPQPQQAYPQPQGYPQQQGYPPQPPGYAPPAPGGSWAADNAVEQRRNAALSSAFAPGGGWRSMSRGRGAAIFAAGLVLLGINIASLVRSNEYYIQAMFITPLAIFLGLYMLIVGTPIDPRTRDLAAWAKVGYGVTTV